ncbi:hypothetical protein AB0A05_37235 [Streptomyces sp. NPDC046374]|uniref:hypothetical protein n=1 Tax=Streptomyces sp. NPDC046374 TaxID=3154917 RepID=UPI0033D9DF50
MASQAGAALFRVALAEPDTEVEVSIGGRTLRYAAERGRTAGPGYWQMAVTFALITGVREDLAPLVLTGPTFAHPDGSAYTAYRAALHAYLNGAETRPGARARTSGWPLLGAGPGRSTPAVWRRARIPRLSHAHAECLARTGTG